MHMPLQCFSRTVRVFDLEETPSYVNWNTSRVEQHVIVTVWIQPGLLALSKFMAPVGCIFKYLRWAESLYEADSRWTVRKFPAI
jgi:hypothetical protein